MLGGLLWQFLAVARGGRLAAAPSLWKASLGSSAELSYTLVVVDKSKVEL